MPNAISIELLAPLSGIVIPIESVPDPVFSQKLVGDGVAIDPVDGLLRSPCRGKVSQLHPAHHAVTIQSDEGLQVLLHIGLDTVKLKGHGFTPRVRLGENVVAGQPLIEFDPDFVARGAKSLISLMVVTEGPAHHLRRLPPATVRSGADAILAVELQSTASTTTAAANRESAARAESAPVAVQLATGLHARPAALLVGVAKKFAAQVEVRKGTQRANAKSVVGLLGLAVGHGESVSFTAEGSDAAAAVRELATFLQALEEDASHNQPSEPAPVALKRPNSTNVIGGVAASGGLAIGRVSQLKNETFQINETGTNPGSERASLTRALADAIAELGDLRGQVAKAADPAQAAIFAAHQELLEDPDLIDEAMRLIHEGKSAAWAWNRATLDHAERLSRLKNELMANRANDLRDIGRRVLRKLAPSTNSAPALVHADTILIAENLTPSDTVQLDRGKVLGFCTVTGGATSHVAILARSLGLPALAGIDERALMIPDGTEVILDGDKGEIRLNPTDEEKHAIREAQDAQAGKRRAALDQAARPAVTRDGRTIEVAANIGGVADARKAVEMGCDGVGLLRSEFLFLERSTPPSEDEQARVYQEIADVLGERPLVIRTLDVGGDKPLKYLPIPPEENPFLGVRGVRVGFLRPEILREQLRAILRVRSKGTLHVMFPMISMLSEFREAKAMLEEERQKLGAPPVKVGIMVEVPSAALIADELAKECDFFSVGTNDLTQYTLAMDRGHKDLAKRVDALHPSVLKLIDLTVRAARRHGRWVGVCGGLASETAAIPVLLGLGVDELSVSIPTLPLVKSHVRETDVKAAETRARRVLELPGASEVRHSLQGGL